MREKSIEAHECLRCKSTRPTKLIVQETCSDCNEAVVVPYDHPDPLYTIVSKGTPDPRIAAAQALAEAWKRLDRVMEQTAAKERRGLQATDRDVEVFAEASARAKAARAALLEALEFDNDV